MTEMALFSVINWPCFQLTKTYSKVLPSCTLLSCKALRSSVVRIMRGAPSDKIILHQLLSNIGQQQTHVDGACWRASYRVKGVYGTTPVPPRLRPMSGSAAKHLIALIRLPL